MSLLQRILGSKEGPPPQTAPHVSPPPTTEEKRMFDSITKPLSHKESDYEPTGGSNFNKRLRWLINAKEVDQATLDITPAMADAMLKYNDRNRPISKARVTFYAVQMAAGDWRYTRVPIIFSDNGRLIDGQHRLLACLESGKSFRADVSFGAPDDSFYFIDVGKTRTASDIFAINDVPNSIMAAAATRFLMAYDEGKQGGDGARGASAVNLDEVYKAYCGYEGLQESIKSAGLKFNHDRLPSPSTAAAIHYLCAQRSRRAADEYFEKIASGLGFSSRKDPAYKVRNFLTREEIRFTRRNVAAGLTQGWKALRTRRPLGSINPDKIERVN